MSPQKPGESNQAQGAPLGIMIDWFPPSMREGVLPNSDKEITFVQVPMHNHYQSGPS